MSLGFERLQDALARCDMALMEAGIPRSTGTEEDGTFRRSSTSERIAQLHTKLQTAEQERAEQWRISRELEAQLLSKSAALSEFREKAQEAEQHLGQVREEVKGLREAAENGAMCLEAISYVYQIGEAGNDAKTIRKQLAALSATPSDGCGKGWTDKERLDWLDSSGEWLCSVGNDYGPTEEDWRVHRWLGADSEVSGQASTLREAIDKAMEAASSKGKEGGE